MEKKGEFYEDIRGALLEIKNKWVEKKICHEGTFESAFYMYLRQSFESKMIDRKIWTQVKLKNQDGQSFSIDMAILQIDTTKSVHLKNQIKEIDVLIEIKYVQMLGTTLDDFKNSFDIKKVSNKTKNLEMDIRYDINKMISLKEKCTTMDSKTNIVVGETYCIGCIENISNEYTPCFFIIKDGKEMYSLE